LLSLGGRRQCPPTETSHCWRKYGPDYTDSSCVVGGRRREGAPARRTGSGSASARRRPLQPSGNGSRGGRGVASRDRRRGGGVSPSDSSRAIAACRRSQRPIRPECALSTTGKAAMCVRHSTNPTSGSNRRWAQLARYPIFRARDPECICQYRGGVLPLNYSRAFEAAESSIAPASVRRAERVH
jgi:hypothetical protein